MSSDGTVEDCNRDNCPGRWTCWGSYYREVEAAVIDLKRELGHADHDGWRTEDGVATTYCGCGAVLYSMPQRYATGIADGDQT